MDFTLEKYTQLLTALKQSGITFRLRHDVDLLPQNSLRTARIESKLGLVATYYFRMVPESYDEGIIKEIAGLGHEIGYHYESLTTCNGDMEKAYQDFCKNCSVLFHKYAEHCYFVIRKPGSYESASDSRA